jgi:GNAT superfamily N-acetyltransferase
MVDSDAVSVIVRPMLPDDVEAASAVGGAALESVIPPEFLPATEEEGRLMDERRAFRVAHMQAQDPGGAWVAENEDDGAIVGVSLAIVREGIWGLSLLGVAPGQQGAGIGGRLLAGALQTYDDRCRGGLILASTDPRALRRYVRAGFALKPCVAATGQINRSRIPAGLQTRAGDPAGERDRALMDAASRFVRGASHAQDLPGFIDTGGTLLVHDGGGWAVVRDGSPLVLAAREEAVATDLLWSCFAAGKPGETVHVDFVAGGHGWAIAACLDMGLSLNTEGPVFVRGETGTMAPYLPSGAYL